MFSSMFIPEAECEELLAHIREIMDNDRIFAFEKVEDIERLLKNREKAERARYDESMLHIY